VAANITMASGDVTIKNEVAPSGVTADIAVQSTAGAHYPPLSSPARARELYPANESTPRLELNEFVPPRVLLGHGWSSPGVWCVCGQ
jgi:hypothetical protein